MRSTRTTCCRGSNQEHTVVGTRCFRAVPGPSRVVSRVRGSRRAQLLSFFRAWVRTVVCRCFSFACAGTAGPRCRGARACLVSRTHGCFVSCVQALCAGHEPLFCVARAGHQVLCGTEPFCSVCAGTSAGFWARAAVFCVQARTVLRGANRCCPGAQNKQSPSKRASGRCASTRSTRCRGRAQVFCSFTRAGSRHQVPGGHEHGRVLCFCFSVQAAGPNTGVFCVLCFPLARACTWRRVLVSGHEPGCVLSRVQAPGTNTAVFVFWVLFPPARADAPARTRLFRAGASRFVCVCGHEQSCFLFARLQTHVLVSACVRVCLFHEDNTSTTCSLCSVRADARHRASNHPERASVCVCVCCWMLSAAGCTLHVPVLPGNRRPGGRIRASSRPCGWQSPARGR